MTKRKPVYCSKTAKPVVTRLKDKTIQHLWSDLKQLEIMIRELKKLRRQLQGNVSLQLNFGVELSLLRLFHVHHVVQNRRSALSLAWHEWFSCKGKEEKIYCCELPSSTEPQIWKFLVVVWQIRQNIAPKACRTCSTIIFLHSTNQIIDLWRCRWTLPSSDLKLPNGAWRQQGALQL